MQTIAYLALGIISLVVLVMAGLVFWWISCLVIPRWWGDAPYVPTSDETAERMIRLAKVKPEDVVMDFGSGNGKLVILAAKAGAKEAIGYEIHPGLVRLSRVMARLKGVGKRTRFVAQSYWDAEVSGVSLVLLFQLPTAMEKIAEKLKKELPPGARIVSNRFVLPGWTVESQEEDVRVYRK